MVWVIVCAGAACNGFFEEVIIAGVVGGLVAIVWSSIAEVIWKLCLWGAIWMPCLPGNFAHHGGTGVLGDCCAF